MQSKFKNSHSKSDERSSVRGWMSSSIGQNEVESGNSRRSRYDHTDHHALLAT